MIVSNFLFSVFQVLALVTWIGKNRMDSSGKWFTNNICEGLMISILQFIISLELISSLPAEYLYVFYSWKQIQSQ